ncbi:hypothetical protein LGL55_01000 [Clostridium tagluense]|uniref:hypothetical protein n=1 Tax=Clostridium TaxID=1485 RepID=UPI0013E96E02|nr:MULTISPECIES: hypothetical protein [Clostridium]MBU3126325.1 hypothetical protein [Clostridium tagluense]MBW9156005.1 hypothetical protein [Clostridium tagluense]MBZ9624163.1 hypothetical protein [Clostridium sp. FP2]MBZ9635666.1 hypothetical protein [Clostridium sp. FP1]MCB2298442.1 hypothetical protein [Clostridium tagluense]
MQRGVSGFLGGVLGGFIMLVINFGETGTSSVSSWIMHILITGFVGWIISKILSKKSTINFVYSGTITGIVLCLLINVVYMLSGRIAPTWSMGLSTFIVSFFSYIVLGIVITATISKSQVKVTK